jgi:hypothetical protein
LDYPAQYIDQKSKSCAVRNKKQIDQKLDGRLSNASDSENEFVDDDDICAVCGNAWVDQINIDSEKINNYSDDLLNVMILCDCCGSSCHMFCVDLLSVPENDWYCQHCKKISSFH